MSTIATAPEQQTIPQPPKNLPSEDGIPLESEWHFREIMLLIELVSRHFAGRDDYFAGGNMFIYYNAKQARNQDFRGPDFFFVRNVPLHPQRPYWAVWEEGGKYPDVIIELSSPTTAHVDRTVKKKIYEQIFRTFEYFIYDPEKQKLEGWRLGNHHYQEITPNEKNWLWSEDLGLWLGIWEGQFQNRQGVFLRFFDPNGKLIATSEEVAEFEKQRARQEQERAEAAETELARLKDRLGKSEG